MHNKQEERDKERLEEIRELNRATLKATGEQMSEEEITDLRPSRYLDRREFKDDDWESHATQDSINEEVHFQTMQDVGNKQDIKKHRVPWRENYLDHLARVLQHHSTRNFG